MEPPVRTSIEAHFGALTDPRGARTRVHRLGELVTIGLCAVLCVANDWVAVETFGRAREACLRTGPDLAGRDSLARHVRTGVRAAGPGRVPALLCGLGAGGARRAPPQVVAVHGETLRRSGARAEGQPALHLLCAWATASGLVMGQEPTDAKCNVITALPRLLRLLARRPSSAASASPHPDL